MRSVSVVLKSGDKTAEEVAKKLLNLLLPSMNFIEVFPEIPAEFSRNRKVVKLDDIRNANGEILIVIGGDGTVLRSLIRLGDRSLPIMVIGVGERNFLACIRRNELKKAVDLLLSGKYIIKRLSRLQATIGNEKLPPALNEVFIGTSLYGRAIRLEIRILSNERRMEIREKMDGLIISTPTGSTAYSLSAGGPIVSSDVKSLVLTFVCSQKRLPSIVLPEETKLEVRSLSQDNPGVVVIDGNFIVKLNPLDIVNIEKSQSEAVFIDFGFCGRDSLEKWLNLT